MTDQRSVLSTEDIIQLGSRADVGLAQVQTPGLNRLSGPERVIGTLLLLVLGGMAYVHLNIRPILPWGIDPYLGFVLNVFAIIALIAAAIIILSTIIAIVFFGLGLLREMIFPRKPRVICPACGTWNHIDNYMNGKNCTTCGSDLVYCGKCGMPVSFSRILWKKGCEKCGANSVAVKWR